MNIEKIQDLAIKFRDAADSAFEYGALGQGYPFNNFPHRFSMHMLKMNSEIKRA